MYTTRNHAPVLAALLLAAIASVAWSAPADDQFTVAANHYARERWQLAAEEFQLFLDQYSSDSRAASAKFFLAETLVQQGQYAKAQVHFEEFLEQHDEHSLARQARFRLGETAYLLSESPGAIEHLTAFVQQYQDDALCGYALPYLGELKLAAGEGAAAVEHFSEALRRYPEGPLVDACRLGMARSLELQGQWQEAVRFYEFLSSRSESALADDAQLQIAIVHYERRQYGAAIRALDHFDRNFPASELRTHARYWRGMSHLAQKNWAEASRTLLELIATDSEHELAAASEFSAAEALRQAGQADEALQHYQHVGAAWPESEWVDDSAQASVDLLVAGERYADAIVAAEQFERHHAGSELLPLVRQLHGRALLKQQQFAEARDVFEQLRSAADPAHAESSAALAYYHALALLGCEQFRPALETLDQITLEGQSAALIDGVHVARAMALMPLKRYEEAVAPLEAYLASRPGGGDAAKCRTQLVIALAQLGRLQAAQEQLDQLRLQEASAALLLPATHHLAEAAMRADERSLARQLYETLQQADDANYRGKGRAGMAWLAWDADKPAESAAAFERLLASDPDSQQAPQWALLRARALEKLQRHEEAFQQYQQLAADHPQSEQAAIALLDAAQLADQLQRDAEAAALLEQLLDAYPKFGQRDAALYQWAWVLIDLGQVEQSDEKFRQLHDEHPESRYWADATYRLAERAARAEQNEAARKLANELAEAGREHELRGHALYLLGQLAAADQQWADVVTPMQQLVEQYPENNLVTAAEYWVAEAKYRLGDYDEAERRFVELEQAAREQQASWLAMIPLRRAQILAQRKNWAEAKQLIGRLAADYPDFRQMYEVDYLLGRCLASQARFDEARDAYQRVVRSPQGGRTETAAMAQWMIGETYFLQKEYDEAIRAYHRVEGLFDWPQWQAAALLQAGKCHELQGRSQEAVRLYVQLLKEFPDSNYAQDASQRLRAAGGGVAAAADASLTK